MLLNSETFLVVKWTSRNYPVGRNSVSWSADPPFSLRAGKLELPPPDIRRRGKDLIRVLTNENRAQGSKDLTKQQGLPSIFFFKLLLLLLLFGDTSVLRLLKSGTRSHFWYIDNRVALLANNYNYYLLPLWMRVAGLEIFYLPKNKRRLVLNNELYLRKNNFFRWKLTWKVTLFASFLFHCLLKGIIYTLVASVCFTSHWMHPLSG